MTETSLDGATDAGSSPAGRHRAGWLPLVTKVAAGALAVFLLFRAGGSLVGLLPRFAGWVDGLGVWGPVVFVAGYVAATVAFVPGLVLTMAAGAIFGLAQGTLLVFIGASLGATSAFLIARYLARDSIEKKLESKPRFAAIDRAVGREGLKVTLLLRLSPAFPFNLLNYALGLTKVRLLDYVVACVGMLPGSFLYVYLGSAIGSIAAIAAGERGEADTAKLALLIVGLAATAVVTVLVTRIARRALAREVDGQEAPNG